MSKYDRVFGVSETGQRVPDHITPNILSALLGEYDRGNLIRGLKQPLDYGTGELTAQGATSTIQPDFTLHNDRVAILITHGETSKAIASVVDDQGNTWDVDHTGNGGTGTDYVSFASARITTPVLDSDDIDITWTDATSGTIQYSLLEADAMADPAFVEAVTTYMPDENVTLNMTVFEQTALFLACIHSNGGGGFTSLSGLEDVKFEAASADTEFMSAAIYTPSPVQLLGTWGTPGDGVVGGAVYAGLRDMGVSDLAARELSSPLTLDERRLLRDFTEQVDAAVDVAVYLQELRDILTLAERLTPGYTDQTELATRLGV